MDKKMLKVLEALLDDKSPSNELPFEVGEKYLIRTVTYFATGQVKEIIGKFLILEEAAWIADTGSFGKAIADGILDEVEPVDEMILNTDTVTDAFVWKHKLPREVK